MMKKIVICLVLILIALQFVQPNFHTFQKIGMSLLYNKKEHLNDQNMAIYRNNPNEYFALLEQKQQKNITNIYIKYTDKAGVQNYFKKNKLQKEINYIKSENNPNEFIGKVTVQKNKTQFEFPTNPTGFFPVVIKKTGELKEITNEYLFVKINVDDLKTFRFIQEKKDKQTGNTCSVWRSATQAREWSDSKKRYTTNVTSVEYCFDEKLGINYYTTVSSSKNIIPEYLFKIEEIKLDSVKDEDFLFPKQFKAIISKKLIEAFKKESAQ